MSDRKSNGQFADGNSGGPGRGKSADGSSKAAKAKAQENSDAMIDTLVKIALDENGSSAARVSAAVAVLDRAHGKPKQAVEVEDTSERDNSLFQRAVMLIEGA